MGGKVSKAIQDWEKHNGPGLSAVQATREGSLIHGADDPILVGEVPEKYIRSSMGHDKPCIEEEVPAAAGCQQGHRGIAPSMDDCIMVVMMLLEEVGFLLQEHLWLYGTEFLEHSQPVDIRPFFSHGGPPQDPCLVLYRIPEFFADHWDNWCQTKDLLGALTREEISGLFD